MTFRASLFAQGAFGYGLTVLFALIVCGLLYIREYVPVFLLAGPVLSATARLYARKMSFYDRLFRYDGWFCSIVIPYSEIARVERSSRVGYPADRWHGPHEYRITTNSKRYWVSLLWFNAAAARAFHEKVIRRGKE